MTRLELRGTTCAAIAAVLFVPLVVAFAPVKAHAQAVDRYNQGIARKPAREIALTPRDASDASTDTTPLIPALRGVVIVNDPAAVKGRGTAGDGVVVAGDAVPQQVIDAANGYLGNVVTLASLDAMTRAMVLAYRDAGLPVVNVVVPPQDITNGVIQIIAVVGRLGELGVEGNASDPAYYTDGFPLGAGDVIEEGPVLDHLRWKSRRLHRRVNAIYEPGAAFSQTDVTLQVQETKPWAIFAGIDNTGSRNSVGELRIFGGFSIADVTGIDHELSYQYTTSEDGPDALSAHVLSYILPVWNWTDFQLTLAHVTTATNNGVIASDGTSYQIGGTFITQLPRHHTFARELRYGFEYKNSDNNLEFGGTPITDNVTEIGQLHVQLSGQSGDARSATNMYGGIWYSPGGLFDRNTDAAFQGSRTGAVANYTYVRAGLDHTIFLPGDFRFVMEGDAQASNRRLISSEQVYVGGMNTVRGFDENALKGDNGAFVRFELYTPGYSLLADKTNGTDQLRFYAFFDAGMVSSNSPSDAATDVNGSIAGTGVGLSYQVGDNFAAEVAYGWQVQDTASVDTLDDGQLHFRLLARF